MENSFYKRKCRLLSKSELKNHRLLTLVTNQEYREVHSSARGLVRATTSTGKKSRKQKANLCIGHPKWHYPLKRGVIQ